MKIKTIGASEYLFIEVGDFRASHPADWKSLWYVLKRKF